MTVLRMPAALIGDRGGLVPRLIVLHSTEGPTAKSAAWWFQNPKSRASAHFVVDEVETIRCVDDDRVAYAAQGTHRDGLQLEITGHAKWTRAEWLAKTRTLDRAAEVVAEWCREFVIPAEISLDPKVISRPSWRGITTHKACNAAFPGRSNHWDPGDGFPLDVLLERVVSLLGPRPSQAPTTDPQTPRSRSIPAMPAVQIGPTGEPIDPRTEEPYAIPNATDFVRALQSDDGEED